MRVDFVSLRLLENACCLSFELLSSHHFEIVLSSLFTSIRSLRSEDVSFVASNNLSGRQTTFLQITHPRKSRNDCLSVTRVVGVDRVEDLVRGEEVSEARETGRVLTEHDIGFREDIHCVIVAVVLLSEGVTDSLTETSRELRLAHWRKT